MGNSGKRITKFIFCAFGDGAEEYGIFMDRNSSLSYFFPTGSSVSEKLGEGSGSKNRILSRNYLGRRRGAAKRSDTKPEGDASSRSSCKSAKSQRIKVYQPGKYGCIGSDLPAGHLFSSSLSADNKNPYLCGNEKRLLPVQRSGAGRTDFVLSGAVSEKTTSNSGSLCVSQGDFNETGKGSL